MPKISCLFRLRHVAARFQGTEWGDVRTATNQLGGGEVVRREGRLRGMGARQFGRRLGMQGWHFGSREAVRKARRQFGS